MPSWVHLTAAARVALVVWLSLVAAFITVEAGPAVTQGEAAGASPRDCVRGQPEPLLVSAPGKPRPVFRRTGPREAVETLRIDPATRLTIRHFGCAHFALELTFVTGAGGPRSPAAWLSRAAEWLQRLPVVPDQQQIVRHIARRLQQAATEPYTFGTPLPMSETAALTVELHRSRSDTRLVVLYEVAL